MLLLFLCNINIKLSSIFLSLSLRTTLVIDYTNRMIFTAFTPHTPSGAPKLCATTTHRRSYVVCAMPAAQRARYRHARFARLSLMKLVIAHNMRQEDGTTRPAHTGAGCGRCADVAWLVDASPICSSCKRRQRAFVPLW